MDDALLLDAGRSEKQVEKALRLLVGAVAARDPEDCLQSLKRFPIDEIESAALAPNPAEWKRAMVRAAEMLVNYGRRLSPDARSAASAELAVGCNELLHAIQRATAEESVEKTKPKRPSSPRGNSTDTPTDADRTVGQKVLSNMGTRNPSKEAFRKAVRATGHSISNAKAGKLLDELTK